MKPAGLKNPVAVATVASSEQGQKAIGQVVNAAKIALLLGGSLVAINYGWKKYKEWRADKYARENVGNPNLLAAAVIYNSFTRFEPPGFLSWILPSFDISTDEAALNNIASQITNVKAVSDAYKILFDRNLYQDTVSGLDSDEIQTFWNLINSPELNNDNTLYPIGSRLYVADRNGIIVNIADNTGNGWVGTGDLYGNFNRNELVGEVLDHGILTPDMVDSDESNIVGQNYYIVKEVRWNQCVWDCKTGVVIQEQITNQET